MGADLAIPADDPLLGGGVEEGPGPNASSLLLVRAGMRNGGGDDDDDDGHGTDVDLAAADHHDHRNGIDSHGGSGGDGNEHGTAPTPLPKAGEKVLVLAALSGYLPARELGRVLLLTSKSLTSPFVTPDDDKDAIWARICRAHWGESNASAPLEGISGTFSAEECFRAFAPERLWTRARPSGISPAPPPVHAGGLPRGRRRVQAQP